MVSLQATAMGLIAHQMAGFDVEKARVDLSIPAGFEPVAMIALGYPGDPAILDERLRQRELAPRERKSAEVCYRPGAGTSLRIGTPTEPIRQGSWVMDAQHLMAAALKFVPTGSIETRYPSSCAHRPAQGVTFRSARSAINGKITLHARSASAADRLRWNVSEDGPAQRNGRSAEVGRWKLDTAKS
ncbi:MAG: hypothetical protein MRJ92_13065 [Nitrospira sp.]|nr:hypothetical protein [Nitrospira sp.]